MSLKKYAIIDTIVIILSMLIVEIVITKLIVHALMVDVNDFKFKSAATFSVSLALVLITKTRWKWMYLVHIIPLTILMWWMANFNLNNLVIILGGNVAVGILLIALPKRNCYKTLPLIGISLLTITVMAIGRSTISYIYEQSNFVHVLLYYLSLDALGIILTPLILSFANSLGVVGDAKTHIEALQIEYKAKEEIKRNERTNKS